MAVVVSVFVILGAIPLKPSIEIWDQSLATNIHLIVLTRKVTILLITAGGLHEKNNLVIAVIVF